VTNWEMSSRTKNVTLVYGAIPTRKSKALSVLRGSVINPVAYFRNDEAYEDFVAAMHEYLGGEA